MVLEIEYSKGDFLLYGKNVSQNDLEKQLIEIENFYDRHKDNFINLLCRRFGWEILNTDDLPEFRYDRDTGMLAKIKL